MCFIFEDSRYNAKSIKWIGINNKALPQEYVDLIKRIDYTEDMIILRAVRDLTKGTIDIPEDDLLLGAIQIRLKEPKEVVICYETSEGDRAFKFEDCIYDHSKDEDPDYYIYNKKDIYLKFKPVDHKTKVPEQTEISI